MIRILESFYNAYSISGMHIEVFKNPSWKEMVDAGGEFNAFRFFAFSDKTLYVWNANVFHTEIANEIFGWNLDKLESVEASGELLSGAILIRGYKNLNIESMDGGRETIKGSKPTDWKWLVNDYYFPMEMIDQLTMWEKSQEYV